MRIQPKHYWKNDLKKFQALNGIPEPSITSTEHIGPNLHTTALMWL